MAPVVCDFLLQPGAPIEIQIGPSKTPVHPQMVALGGGAVALGYGAVQNEFPAPGPPGIPSPDLHFAVLDALGAWPTAPIPTIGPSWNGQGNSYAFNPDTASSQGFSVLSAQGQGADSTAPVQQRFIDLTTMLAGDPVTLFPLGSAALFSRTTGGASLAAASAEESPGQYRLGLARLSPAVEPINEGVGCATAPILADSVPDSDGSTILAVSSSRPAFSCDLDNGVNGPPTSVQLINLQLTTPPKGTSTAEVPLGDAVTFLRLIPRDFGAWLVTGTGPQENQPLRMMSVVPGGFLGQQIVDLTEGAVIPTGPAVNGMGGDRVALAYVENGGQVPHLMLRSRSGDSSASVGVDASNPADLAVFSPSPDTILLAWTEMSPLTPRLLVARYRCEHAE
jgi:hypothetical protein